MKHLSPALIVYCFSHILWAQPFLDIADAFVRFDAQSGRLIVESKAQPDFFSTAPQNIQLVNWAFADARSRKTGLNLFANKLVANQYGKTGVFLIDTRRISCKPVQGVEDLVEIFFDGGTENQLKICENTVVGASGLINCMAIANQKGGGFLRLQVKDNVVLGADTCQWQRGHPRAQGFSPNAWHQTDTRIADVLGVQLLSDLFVLDPRTLRTGHTKKSDWVGEEGLIVTLYQRDAVETLVDEARRRDAHIACSKELQNRDGRKAEDFFCFVIAKALVPVTDFSEEETNSAASVRKRGGYTKF